MAVTEKLPLISPEVHFLDTAFKRFLRHFRIDKHDLQSEKIFLGVFGKHPVWNDHIDDIGLETDVLIAAKHKLYVQGIGGNVDSGSWGRLTNDHRIEDFDRQIFWHMDGSLIVGRMWSSQDGKGRRSYPFIVCVECWKLPTQWILENVLPQLEKIKGDCTAADSAKGVRLAIQQARQNLRRSAQRCESSSNSMAGNPNALSKLAERHETGLDQEGLLRILYHLDREVGCLRPGPAKAKTSRSALLRLPTCPETSLEDTFLWSSFLLTKLGTSTSILVLVPPVDNRWIDLIVGEPTESQLYCLRASTKVIPLTSTIPYNISSEFVNRANRLIYGQNQ